MAPVVSTPSLHCILPGQHSDETIDPTTYGLDPDGPTPHDGDVETVCVLDTNILLSLDRVYELESRVNLCSLVMTL